MTKIWEMVKNIEETQQLDNIGEIKTTLIVNFGPKGKCRPNLISGEENTTVMLMMVLSWYEKELKHNENKLNLVKKFSNMSLPDENDDIKFED